MFEFTIHEAAFLNEFKEKIRAYVNKSYQYTMRFLASPVVCDYRDNERLILISVNQSGYQNLYSFLHLNESHMQYAAFACLENALYAMRVYEALVLDPADMHAYITSPDFSVEESERAREEARNNREYSDAEEQFSVKEFYNALHAFNTFALKTPAVSSQLHNKNVFLGLSCGRELSDELQNEVRKNMVGAYLSLRKHMRLFFNGGIDEEMEDFEDEIHEMFTDYVKKF